MCNIQTILFYYYLLVFITYCEMILTEPQQFPNQTR